MSGPADLTWDRLDELVDTDTLALRDEAWAEITRLRARVDSLSARNASQGRHMVGLEAALAALQQVVRQFVDDADRQRDGGISPGGKPTSWYVERFRELVAR